MAVTDTARNREEETDRERKTHEKRFSIAALLSALPASMRAATERNITRCRNSDIEINGYRQGNVSIIPEAFLTSVSWNKKKKRRGVTVGLQERVVRGGGRADAGLDDRVEHLRVRSELCVTR